jgi:hypothetical protein
LTSAELDRDLEEYMGGVPVATAKAVTAIETTSQATTGKIALSTRRLLPVSMKSGPAYMSQLLDGGYRTDGRVEKLSDGESILWFEKDESQELPILPDLDRHGSFRWERITTDDLPTYQARGWYARSICRSTNRIWVCVPNAKKRRVVKIEL